MDCLTLQQYTLQPCATLDCLTTLHECIVAYFKAIIIVAGDFNLPNIICRKLSSLVNQIMFDTMLASDLEQAVDLPTRVQESSSSVLDLVFHSSALCNLDVTVEEGIPDRKLVRFTCEVDRSNYRAIKECRTVKNFSIDNDESVLDYLKLALKDFSANMSSDYGNSLRSSNPFATFALIISF